MKKINILIIAMLVLITINAEASDRIIKKVKLRSNQIVVAEGDFEARSIGSFSVRLYEAAPPEDETTFFIAGLIYTRDGTIENVVLSDINGDRRPEIIVIIRTVGTGGYLSSHAFAVENNKLTRIAVVEGLPADANCIEVFRRLKLVKE